MRKQRGFRERFYRALIRLIAVCIVVLVLVIVTTTVWNRREDHSLSVRSATAAPQTSGDNTLVIYRPKASATPESTPVPETTPTPAPSPAPEETPDLLPIWDHAEIKAAEIAITVNDLSQAANLQKMAAAANNYAAKLTLFPSLNACNDEFAAMMIAKCVNEYGFDMENSGSFGTPVYKMDDEAMARNIWELDNAIDGVAGGDYEVFFYRPFGALGIEDERTHAYLRQLGYKGIVTWSVNGSALDMNSLMESLAPGQIYLFDSNNKDTAKLIEFLNFVYAKGYRVVTLNSMLGFRKEPVTDHDVSFLFATPVPLEPYKQAMHTVQRNERSYLVYSIQRRLIELGYATEDLSDGVFGPATASAISIFQTRNGLQGTGTCSVEVQNLLFSEEARPYGGDLDALTPPEPTPETTEN